MDATSSCQRKRRIDEILQRTKDAKRSRPDNGKLKANAAAFKVDEAAAANENGGSVLLPFRSEQSVTMDFEPGTGRLASAISVARLPSPATVKEEAIDGRCHPAIWLSKTLPSVTVKEEQAEVRRDLTILPSTSLPIATLAELPAENRHGSAILHARSLPSLTVSKESVEGRCHSATSVSMTSPPLTVDTEKIKVRGDLTAWLTVVNLDGNENTANASLNSTHTSECSTTVSRLPDGMLAQILCHLSVLDLLRSCVRVCRQWKAIIMDPQFMPWKKEYHALKNGKDAYLAFLPRLVKQTIIQKVDGLSWVINTASEFKRINLLSGQSLQSVTAVLKQHRRYCCAAGMLFTKFPHNKPIFLDDATLNPWSVVASMVILSNSTKEIRSIKACLEQRHCCLSAQEVLDFFYCVASLLLYLQVEHGCDVWNSMHYWLYHCLNNCTESVDHGLDQSNESVSQPATGSRPSVASCGQKKKLDSGSSSSPQSHIALTQQQRRIVSYNIEEAGTMKVIGFAGTGKTACLVEYARARPHLAFLYVVYNKSVAEYAARLFPRNVECRTGHSLAYKVVGKRYRRPREDLQIYSVAQAVRKRQGFDVYVQARMVMDTLKNFLASADAFITIAHVPSHGVGSMGSNYSVPLAMKMVYAEDAEAYWQLMVGRTDRMGCMTHDGYLKLWQLEGCNINKSTVMKSLSRVDCILIDEAQDMTPALADVLLNQDVPKIVAGDLHLQKIYAFKGAVNALDCITATKTFYLTKSFRFGSRIGFVAETLLDYPKHVRHVTILCCDKADCISPRGTFDSQSAVIARSKFGLLVAAEQYCSMHAHDSIHIIGGIKGLGFQLMLDIYRLMKNDTGSINSAFIRRFPCIAALERWSNEVNDVEIHSKLKFVRQYDWKLPEILSMLESRHTSLSSARAVFTTAHKAKGLEFDTVTLVDDFVSMPLPATSAVTAQTKRAVDSIREDEKKLLYAAATRARKCLTLNRCLYAILSTAGGLTELPQCPRYLDAPAGSSSQASALPSHHNAVLVRQAFCLFDGTTISGETMNSASIASTRPAWSKLLGSVKQRRCHLL